MDKLIALLEELKPGVDYRNEKHLVTDQLLDSMTLVELVAQLEDVFGACVGMEDFVPENFESADAMLAMIERLK